jgi:DNA-binding response OmpR family regulator
MTINDRENTNLLEFERPGSSCERVLVAEDDAMFRRILQSWLETWGYRVTLTEDGAQAWKALQQEPPPQLLILDWMMPKTDGVELCRKVREQNRTPYQYILLATAKDGRQDLVKGLEAGADDYLTKPFDFRVLIARIGALARRAQPSIPPVLEHGDVMLDTAKRCAHRAGRPLTLRPKEFGVLEQLLAAEGRVVSAEELLERVWDETVDPFSATVKITISRLRAKLGQPPLIETIAKAGYRI